MPAVIVSGDSVDSVDHRDRPGRIGGQEQGYTLLELLVVLVIIGLLVAVATPQVMRMLGGAKSDAARLQIEALTTALDYYQTDIGSYPTQAQGLAALWRKPEGLDAWNGPYIRKEKHLTDPWGAPFHYRVPGEKAGAFDLYSYGADGQEGGSGDDADLGNWE